MNGEGGRTEFISGVIEGFYGRPWTLEQRQHLFVRLKDLQLNTYVYAPKDDVKHRLSWREFYTDEESSHLKDLIDASVEQNVTFVYALSPGIDICYSKWEDINGIIEKLKQVRSLGCNAFALLFDDIEHVMHPNDRKKFNTFAEAQVFIANKVYYALDDPVFYFCPTEYCESRAEPNLDESEYLVTIGKQLDSRIQIMWTGPKVVSRYLTVDHCREVAKVLRRKPLIWDNLHANDYDARRIYLGPFSGRSVELKSTISGLLMNPNCKYEANYIPFNTFGDWCAADADAECVEDPDVLLEAGSKTPVADATVDAAKPIQVYHPLHSLKTALTSWVSEFNSSTSTLATADSPMNMSKEEECENDVHGNTQPSTSDLCVMDVAENITTIFSSIALPAEAIGELVRSAVEVVQVPENNQMNLVVANSLAPDNSEPMEIPTTILTHRPSKDIADGVGNDIMELPIDALARKTITESQLRVLVDIFYLPFDYGRMAIELYEQYQWLCLNCVVMTRVNRFPPSARSEWKERSEKVLLILEELNSLFLNVLECDNKALMSEVLPYAWEAHGMCSVISALVKWMSVGNMMITPESLELFWEDDEYVGEPWTWASPAQGFIVDAGKLLASTPLVHALMMNRSLLPISVCCFDIRLVTYDDVGILSSVVLNSCNVSSEDYTMKSSMIFDRTFGFLLHEAAAKYAFLAEDRTSGKVICAIGGVIDERVFNGEKRTSFIQFLQEKYRVILDDRSIDPMENEAPDLEISSWIPAPSPHTVYERFPSRVYLYASGEAEDAIPAKRLIQVMAVALSYNGSKGLHISVPEGNVNKISFLQRLSFEHILTHNKQLYFGHELSRPTNGEFV